MKTYNLIFLGSLGTFWLKTTWLLFPIHHTYLAWSLATFLCFPWLRYHNYDITVIIKAESETVINTLTEQNFQDN
jgi:hypothetical protein